MQGHLNAAEFAGFTIAEAEFFKTFDKFDFVFHIFGLVVWFGCLVLDCGLLVHGVQNQRSQHYRERGNEKKENEVEDFEDV